jgi:2-polyprenyl-6-methoxyphenol hydroxylase-like FAD-dependent oxidoreductase
MLLARRGLRVLAVDRDRHGTDTLSTHALMRGGVLQLHRWGILDRLRAEGTPTVRSTSFHYGDDVIDIQIKPLDGIDGLYAPRRTVIDRLLADAARESGAEIAYRTRLIDLMRSPEGRVCGVQNDRGGRLMQAADSTSCLVWPCDATNSMPPRNDRQAFDQFFSELAHRMAPFSFSS